MTPDERQLISGLFDRMRANGAVDKDREAESFINQSVRQLPDAAYVLVQSVLAQEHYLQQAGARIEELEARVRDLEGQLSQGEAKSSGGGSFLGGLFGGSKPQAPPARAATSVPSTGGRQSPGFGQGSPAPSYGQAGSPWGQQPQPGYAPPAQQAPMQAGSGGPSFMRSALTTAAGVAGGMMAANALQGIFGGHSAHAGGYAGSLPGGGTSPYAVNSAADELRQVDAEQDQDQDDQIADEQQDAEQDSAADASDQQSDDSSSWGSSDDSDV